MQDCEDKSTENRLHLITPKPDEHMHTFNYISCKLSRQVTCDSETETKQVEEKSVDTALRESAAAATSRLKAVWAGIKRRRNKVFQTEIKRQKNKAASRWLWDQDHRLGTVKPVQSDQASHSMAEPTQTKISMITYVIHTDLKHPRTTVFTQFDLFLQHIQTQAKKNSIQQQVMFQSIVTGPNKNNNTQQVTVFRANMVGALC